MKNFKNRIGLLSFVVMLLFSYNIHASEVVQINDVNSLKNTLESTGCKKDTVIEISNNLNFNDISTTKKDISIKCQNVSIKGKDANKIELKAADGFRHFVSDANNAGLSIENLILSLDDSYDYGGGIFYLSEKADLTIKNTTFKGIYGKYFKYGDSKNMKGSAIESNKSTINIDNATFINNIGENSAGTIFNTSGKTIISNSIFKDNKVTTGSNPSVIRTNDAKISNTQFLSNVSEGTSGLGPVQTTTFDVDNSLFMNNVSSNNSGGMHAGGAGKITNSTFAYNKAANSGGALLSATKPIEISNSTFVGNEAKKGGAIEYKEGVSLTQSTIVDNKSQDTSGALHGNNASGVLKMNGSIVIGNKAGTTEVNLVELNDNKWVNEAEHYNLINLEQQDYKVSDIFETTNNNIVLSDNDGFTPTINLNNTKDNAAIDKIPAHADWLVNGLLKDQRGIERPQNKLVDIGAVELVVKDNQDELAAKKIESAISELPEASALTSTDVTITKQVIKSYDDATAQVKALINDTFKTKLEQLRAKVIELEVASEPWDGKTSTEPRKVNDIYQITSGAELKWFADETKVKPKNGYNAILVNDVDLNNKNWTSNIGESSLTPFSGIFDGNNNMIKNFMSNGYTRTSLFGYSSGTIKNLTLSGSIKSAYNDTGSIVSYNEGGTVSNVHSNVEILSWRWNGITNSGGLVGTNRKLGQVLNSSFSGKIYGYTDTGGTLRVGGIVGTNEGATIIGCINKGELIGSKANTNIAYVGGIVADVSYGSGNANKNYVYNNINMAKVSADHPSAKVGSIIGNAYENSSAKGLENYFFNNENIVIGAPIIHSLPKGDYSTTYLDNNYSVAYETDYDKGLVSIADMKKPAFVSRMNSNDGSNYGITIGSDVLYKEVEKYYPTLKWDNTQYDPSDDDNETTQEDQEYVEKAIKALKDSSLKLNAVYAKDSNVNTILNNKLKDLGYDGLVISVSHSTNESNVDKNGLINYFYKDPSTTEDNDVKLSVKFNVNKKSITQETDSIDVIIPWDIVKLEQATKEQISDKITANSIKAGNSDLNSVTTDLSLTKFQDNKLWATANWKSSNESVVNIIDGANVKDDYIGKVTRSNKDEKVKLTLTIKNNRISNEQAPLAITKDFDVIVKADGSSLIEQMQKALDNNYTLAKLTDFVTEKPIEVNSVMNDVQLLSPKELGIENYTDYNFYVTSDSDNLKIDSFKSNDGSINISYYRMYVYRPLEPNTAKDAKFTVTMYNRAANNISVSKDFTIKIKPISNLEIDQAVKFMDDVKADYFNGINNGINKDKDNITQDLKNFHFALNDNGNVKWSYVTPNETTNKFNYEDSVRLVRNGAPQKGDEFFSSNENIIEHDKMIVHRPEKDTKVTISSNLTSHIYAKYAEKYPNDGRFAKLKDQKVSTEVTVLGTEVPAKEAKPANVTVKIEGENSTLMNSTKTNIIAKDISDIVGNSKDTWMNTEDKKPVVTHALVQALMDQGHSPKDVKVLETVNGTYVTSILGESGSWMYLVNNKMTDLSIHQQTLNEGDTITFIFLKDYEKQSLSYFDKDKITVKDNEDVTFKQSQLVVDQTTWQTSVEPVVGASLVTEQLQNNNTYLIKKHDNVISNENGEFKYRFTSPGRYYVTSHLGHNELNEITRSQVTVIVKSSKLEKLLNDSKKIKKGNYTSISYNKLLVEIKAAQNIYNNEKATVIQINSAISKLQKAKNDLKLETVAKKGNTTYYYKYVSGKKVVAKYIKKTGNKTTTNTYVIVGKVNKLKSSKTVTKYKSKNTTTYYNVRTYYKNGRLKNDKRYYRSAKSRKNTRTTSVNYRSNGKKYRYINLKYKKGYRNIRYEYVYNRNGQLKSNKKYGKSYRYVTSYNKKGKAKKTVRKQYNSKGKLAKKTTKVGRRNSI